MKIGENGRLEGKALAFRDEFMNSCHELTLRRNRSVLQCRQLCAPCFNG